MNLNPIVGFAAVGAVALSALLASAHPQATLPAQPCPPGQTASTCVKGTVIFWEDPAHPANNQFVQEDNTGAPQFSVGVGGAASWANPFGVTNNPRTDNGRLMFPVLIGGSWGNGQGRPVITITGNDGVLPNIEMVNGTQRAYLNFPMLQALDNWWATVGFFRFRDRYNR